MLRWRATRAPKGRHDPPAVHALPSNRCLSASRCRLCAVCRDPSARGSLACLCTHPSSSRAPQHPISCSILTPRRRPCSGENTFQKRPCQRLKSLRQVPSCQNRSMRVHVSVTIIPSSSGRLLSAWSEPTDVQKRSASQNQGADACFERGTAFLVLLSAAW